MLPKGAAWQRELGNTYNELLRGLATEPSRVDEQIQTMINNMVVKNADELMPEWEADLGLPDDCTSFATSSLADRQTAAFSKLTQLGGNNPAYFIALAETLGYTITIDEYKPFWCGIGAMGDSCGGQDNIFYWGVNVLYDINQPDKIGAEIECLFNTIKPAHTIVNVGLVGPEFDNAFSDAFNAMPAAELTQGAFSPEFGEGFDVYYGGGFDYNAFSDDFNKPK